MVKAHPRAWGTAPSSPLPRRGPGGRGQAVGWPRASRGPLSPLFPCLWTFSSLLIPEVMCGQCPAQSLSPHSRGSPLGQQAGGWGDRLQAPLFRACQKSWGPDPAASLLPGRAAGPRCGHGEQAVAGRSEDQVPGDRTHHLPTCIWGSSLPWPRPRFPPLPSGPRRWDDPSSSESRSSIFCFCFHF